MTGDDDIPSEDAKTVFMPSGRPTPTPPDEGPGATPREPEARTIPPQSPSLPPPPAAASWPGPAETPPIRPGNVQVGSVLNNIYEVTRRIGGGGMGEVFQGVNVNDDHDRVAIKVMLPSLAADPTVQAMFFKEARTLTRLSHPNVVQYRVLAKEPQLGVFYIVTEFVDGAPLSDVLGSLNAGSADLRNLLRQLASGLRAAHALGTVHRDMSPDNVLLAGGRLDDAKIIDFGIAKDLDPSKQTIIGDGFAGKLGFVAPEQFGDFGREIGPWTDVYSLGLVILSVAAGRNIDMGATLVDAIDKRRAGPDLSCAPADLQPLLQEMLRPDPAQRLRSMDDVLAALDAAPATTTAAPAKATKGDAQTATAATVRRSQTSGQPAGGAPARKGPPVLALGIGGAVVAVILVIALLFVMRPHAKPAAASGTVMANGSVTGAEAVRRALETDLAAVPCSWLDIVSATPSGAGVAVGLTGVAGEPQDASARLSAAAKSAGVGLAGLDLSDVSPADPALCPMLDAFRPIRADTSSAGRRLSTSQTKYTFEKQADGSMAQTAVITMAVGDTSKDFMLYGLDASGLTVLVPSRSWFTEKTTNPANKTQYTDLGGDTYRLSITMTPPAGLQGLVLLTGPGHLDSKLAPVYGTVKTADWARQLADAAKAAGWKAEMVWYRTAAP